MEVTSRNIQSGDYNLVLAGHSKSSEATYFYLPQLKFSFDAGGQSKQYEVCCRHTFLSHTHGDHSIYLMNIQSAYKDCSNQLYVPIEVEEYVFNYIKVFQEMNDCEKLTVEEYKQFQSKQYTLIPVRPSERYSLLNGRFEVEVLDCVHTIPCRGYAFYECRKKLKDEYKGLSGKEIGRLRTVEKVEVTETKKLPRFIYLGDTSIEVFEKNREIFDRGFRIVIVECTYFEEKDSVEKARKRGHIHWNQLREVVKKYQDTVFVLIHFSLKYSDGQIREFFGKEGYKNVIPWLD